VNGLRSVTESFGLVAADAAGKATSAKRRKGINRPTA
jgi:hypothetical protein